MINDIRRRYREQETRFSYQTENYSRYIKDGTKYRTYHLYNDKDIEELIKEINQLNLDHMWHILFVEWLIESGIISDNVPEMFNDTMEYENNYIKEIASIVGRERAEKVYEKLKDNLR